MNRPPRPPRRPQPQPGNLNMTNLAQVMINGTISIFDQSLTSDINANNTTRVLMDSYPFVATVLPAFAVAAVIVNNKMNRPPRPPRRPQPQPGNLNMTNLAQVMINGTISIFDQSLTSDINANNTTRVLMDSYR
ncbi:11908_t:CDS:2 [Ambispora leptoticha]|uniref:11908_t:CDS:1 n=1 Tax=Ambispora leptoticha TaxID=144679 RepID=A0A9N9BE32_9GLOM|nr:11908_t:CDS:2 [Ambispora leptoticha]